MAQPPHILLVDDEVNIRVTLGALLQRAGYGVTPAPDGATALALLAQQPFDLLLVDLKMPGMDGIAVVTAARAQQPDLAVIVLTGHGSLDSAIEGLHQGIADYVLKTTPPPEVIERVHKALAARAQQLRQRQLLDAVGAAVQELRGDGPDPAATAQAEPTRGVRAEAAGSQRRLTVGSLQLDAWRQEVTLAGRTVTLTPTEFRVLLCLAEHAGTVLSFGTLVEYAQGYAADPLEANELIKPHIHHLRQKLEADPGAPQLILTVRGKGYMLADGGPPAHTPR
jgi:DNA-binding response OmpR family regulator